MIKIAFVIDTIESPTAGTEKQLLLLVKHLDRTKFKPYLCVLRSSKWLREEFDLCELFDADILSFKNLSAFRNIYRLSRFFRAEGIDIVQTHFVDANKVGIVAAKLAGVKAIISARRNQGYWHNKSELILLKLLNSITTKFLANSESTRQWTVRTEGVAPDRIFVIYNALEIEYYQKASVEQRLAFGETLGFPPHAIIVGIVANLRPVKAVDVFLRAAKNVAISYPQTRFIVVGEGPERARLELLAAELGIATLVRFLGMRIDVPEILGCIDIGVLSSSSESFSNSIVEYMAAGLSVVCTDVGGAREAVENGINGFVVQLGDDMALADGMVTILSSGNMALMGRSGKDKAESEFSLIAILQQYEKFFEEVVGA